MSHERERDELTARLLHHAFIASASSPPTPDCVDAETMAAWVEGRLPAPRRERVLEHMSSCGRCRAVAAALSRTEVAVHAVEVARIEPFWQRVGVRWALAAAAVVAVVGWSLVRQPELSPEPTQMARVEPTELAPAAPAPSPPAAAESAPTIGGGRPGPVAGVETFSPPARPIENQAAREATELRAEKATALADTVPATTTPPATAAEPLSSRSLTTTERAAGATTVATIVTEFAALPPASAAADARVDVTDGTVRWRILRDGSVWRTQPGVEFERIALDPPGFVMAGTAPAANVCWLVGRSGSVWRSVDGRTFTRVDQPTDADLIRVTAVDALSATVFTADGRSHTTIDGGRSWR